MACLGRLTFSHLLNAYETFRSSKSLGQDRGQVTSPLRYFIYIGITAMIRLIIIDHSSAINMLLYGAVVLLLIIGYFIINITPLERPKKARYEIKNAKVDDEPSYNERRGD